METPKEMSDRLAADLCREANDYPQVSEFSTGKKEILGFYQPSSASELPSATNCL